MRTNKYSIVLCLSVVFALMVFALMNMEVVTSQMKTMLLRPKSDLETTEENRPKVVILLTMMRSGSSILGSIFNEHKNVLYSYEPLFPFGLQQCNETTRRSSVEVLRSMSSCHFENLGPLYKTSNRRDTAQ